MSVQNIQHRVQQLTTEDWQQFLTWVVGAERKRRETLPQVEQAQAAIVKELQDAGQLPEPEVWPNPDKAPDTIEGVPEWRDPGTDHAKMYREGDVVVFGDRLVRSTHKGLNHWQPGTLGFDGRIWEDITPSSTGDTSGQTGATEQPHAAPDGSANHPYTFRPGLAVHTGDHVTYNGRVYRVLSDHTTQADWAPDVVPALYTPEN